MLIIGRVPGRSILIGDHSIVTVVSASADWVDLGFDTADSVRRVDSPELTMEAARVKARLTMRFGRHPTPMEKLPVYVCSRAFRDNEADLRVSFNRGFTQRYGYKADEIGETTHLLPTDRQFVVLRSIAPKEIDAIKLLIEAGLIKWRFCEEIELEDASVYALFVHEASDKDGDVRYLDLSET